MPWLRELDPFNLFMALTKLDICASFRLEEAVNNWIKILHTKFSNLHFHINIGADWFRFEILNKFTDPAKDTWVVFSLDRNARVVNIGEAEGIYQNIRFYDKPFNLEPEEWLMRRLEVLDMSKTYR